VTNQLRSAGILTSLVQYLVKELATDRQCEGDKTKRAGSMRSGTLCFCIKPNVNI